MLVVLFFSCYEPVTQVPNWVSSFLLCDERPLVLLGLSALSPVEAPSRGWFFPANIMADLDGLLHALEERASTARTIFMLLDSDADGLVAVEQVSPCCSAHAPSRVAAAVFPGGAWPACGSLRADARPPAPANWPASNLHAAAPCRPPIPRPISGHWPVGRQTRNCLTP